MTIALLAAVLVAIGFISGATIVAMLNGRAPRWVAGAAYRARGKRVVRVHIERRLESQEGIIGETDMTLEGILLGRWSGMYVLIRAKVIGEDDAHTSLVGDVEVPADRVIFLQTMGGGQ
jgi:hypothetical protein